MASEIDLHLGRRLRRRRRLLGMTQQELANKVGVRFQQIQKYECGANRIRAGRLFDIAASLGVPVQYFYDGREEDGISDPESVNDDDMLSQRDTMEVVRAYYALGKRPRRRLLDLAKALEPS